MSTIYAVGDIVKNIFRVERIMEGGMGVVYICLMLDRKDVRGQAQLKPREPEKKATPKDNSPHYAAVKTFHRELLWHSQVGESFKRECLTWVALLPHPHIVKATTVDLIGAFLHLWLEYIDGGSLRDRIARGPVALEEAISIALQFCVGMEFLYQSGPIVHLDIKPENILLTQTGKVKITDFGLAKALTEKAGAELESAQDSGPAAIAGTVPYMSPEQFRANEADVRADVYGFGVVFYEMMTARRPFQALEFEQYRRLHEEELPVPPGKIIAMPKEIDAVILKCLEKRPEKRWQTFTELRLALEQFCAGNGLERLIVAPPSLASLQASMNADDWNGRGYALAKLGRFEESSECYRKALELDPEGVGSNLNMGTGLSRLGREEEALAYFQREVELHPEVGIVYEPLANYYMKQGRYEEALEAMRKSTGMDPEAIARWRTRGFICLKMKREEEAQKVWEHIKKLLLTVPNYMNPMSVNNEAIISVEMGATEIALEMHAFGVEHYPESALIWYNFAITLHRLERIEEAIACYGRALELDSSLSFASLNRALLLVRLGNAEAAISDLKLTIASDPESTPAGLAASMLEMVSLMGAAALGMFGELEGSLKYIM